MSIYGSSSNTGQVTLVTNELSFSALKYLKTCVWSTIKEARLNGSALLHVHHDLNINFEDVIDDISRKTCRLNFN